MTSEAPLPRGFHRRLLVACVVVLYLANLGVNLAMLATVNANGLLSGEETSVSFRDIALLPERIQHNPLATNIGAHAYYWAASHVLPHIDLFYGRTVKAVTMATIAPLLFLIAVSVLECSLPAAAGVALISILMPGVLNYCWMATEYGLECPTGLLALLLASRPAKAAAFAAAALVAYAAITYPAGLGFFPAVFGMIYWRHGRAPRRPWLLLISVPVVAGIVLAVPALWWTNATRMLQGGGSLSSSREFVADLAQMLHEAVVRGGSYYCGSNDYPALSSPLVWGSALAGMVLTLRQRKHLWLWLVLLGTVGLYAASGRVSGMRRGVPIVMCVLLFAGLFWDALWRRPSRAWRGVAVGLMVLAISWANVQAYECRRHFAKGRYPFQIDFRFVPAPDKTMAQTYDLLLEDPTYLARHTYAYEPDRTLAVLHILATRNGRESAALYTRDRLVRAIEERRAAQRAAAAIQP